MKIEINEKVKIIFESENKISEVTTDEITNKIKEIDFDEIEIDFDIYKPENFVVTTNSKMKYPVKSAIFLKSFINVFREE